MNIQKREMNIVDDTLSTIEKTENTAVVENPWE